MSALWKGKCPRCREGNVFMYSSGKVARFAAMNPACPHCNASLIPEPGFYFGAMFVSYAINVAIFVSCWLVLYLFFEPTDTVYITVIAISALIFTPFNYRASRLLWLYWFGGLTYDPDL
jgi:uncharacterized protein (DUF983 family)